MDHEHDRLVDHLDRLQFDHEAHPDTDAFTDLLSRLGREINTHFDSEEEILRACGMPNEMVLEHIRAHTAILEQYARLNLELMAGTQVTRDEALSMVREWIVDHVLHHDLKLADYTTADA